MLKTKLMMKSIRVGENEKTSRSFHTSYDSSSASTSVKNRYSSSKSSLRTEVVEDFDNMRNMKDASMSQRSARSTSGNRQIAEMKDEDLEFEWERHEAEVHAYLEEREKINDRASVRVSAEANSNRMSFEQFWRESCKLWGDVAILFFYAGTANLLLSIMIYMWAEFFLGYHNTIGAIISVITVGISIVVGIALYFFLRQNIDSRKRGGSVKPNNPTRSAKNSKKTATLFENPAVPHRQESLELDPTLMES